jgi:hypothetical protein
MKLAARIESDKVYFRYSTLARSKFMNAYKVQAMVAENGAVLIQGVPFAVGTSVEVIVLEGKSSNIDLVDSLKNSVIRYEDPFEPAVPAEDWEVFQ